MEPPIDNIKYCVIVEMEEDKMNLNHKIEESIKTVTNPSCNKRKATTRASQNNTARTVSLIMMTLCCAFGTPVTLLCTLPAYILADKVCVHVIRILIWCKNS